MNPIRYYFRQIGRLLFLLACVLPITACEHTGLMKTPNLYIATNDDPFTKIRPEQQKVTVDLLYATDRGEEVEPEEPHGQGIQYGHSRSDSLAFGRATVALGEQVTWEELHEASLTRRRNRLFVPQLTETTELGRFSPAQKTWLLNPDGMLPNDEVVAADSPVAARLTTEVENALAVSDRKEAYVFIHGYNNQFYHATLTMAQLWHFMGRPGVPIVYSWPAGRGGIRGYTFDTESSQFTVFHLKQFLQALAATPGLEKIHILAHSRGTDVATAAIRELMIAYRAAGEDTRTALKLGNLVLAAPDIDVDVVEQTLVADGMIAVPERFTIYLSPKDRALLISSWLMDSVKRLGNLGVDNLSAEERNLLTTLPLLTFINADVKSDITGHAYFWTNPAASTDLILLLRDNLDPGVKNGRPLIRRSDNYWVLRDNYLLRTPELIPEADAPIAPLSPAAGAPPAG